MYHIEHVKAMFATCFTVEQIIAIDPSRDKETQIHINQNKKCQNPLLEGF